MKIETHKSEMEKFNLIIEVSKKIKDKYFKNKNELRKWLINHSFTENEIIRLNWMSHTI